MEKLDKNSLAQLRRQLKKEMNTKLLSLGFTGRWPEWNRQTSSQQHFIYIAAWKYGGGYHLSAGYTKLGQHVAAYPFVKEEFWQTIEEEDVRFVHTLPEFRMNANIDESGGSIPHPNEFSKTGKDPWVATICELVEDLDNWLTTGKKTARLSK